MVLYCVYLLQCSDNSLYCGYTVNIEKRIRTHNAGEGAKYTRSRLPVRLAYLETYPTKSEAMKREAEIKKLSRKDKLALVVSPKNMIHSKLPHA